MKNKRVHLYVIGSSAGVLIAAFVLLYFVR